MRYKHGSQFADPDFVAEDFERNPVGRILLDGVLKFMLDKPSWPSAHDLPPEHGSILRRADYVVELVHIMPEQPTNKFVR
jgi:hypothetical protein